MRSDESGVAEVLDEDPVDEGVLRQGLNHHHPLITQLQQDSFDIQYLKQNDLHHETYKLKTVRWNKTWMLEKTGRKLLTWSQLARI